MYFLASCGTTLAGGSARGQTQRAGERRAMGQDRTAPPTLKTRVTPHRRHPKHLVADRAYDRDPLRERLAAWGTVLISPYRDNNRF